MFGFCFLTLNNLSEGSHYPAIGWVEGGGGGGGGVEREGGGGVSYKHCLLTLLVVAVKKLNL